MRTLFITACLAFALGIVGCSAGETTQEQIDKDAKAITTDPSATPVDSGADVAPMMKKNSGN